MSLITLLVPGQIKTEFGGGIGAFNYTGDLAKKYKFKNHRPAATLHYKYNMGRAVNFKAAITGGHIIGNDNNPDDPFAATRGNVTPSAFKVFVFEASTTFEYNFLDYKGRNPLIFGTPYLYGGFAISGFSGHQSKPVAYSPVQPVVPLGIGLKYVVNPNWYLSMEFGTRLLFFDYLDNVSYGDTRYKDYTYGHWFENDKYYFIGITATYSFYKIPCPTNPY